MMELDYVPKRRTEIWCGKEKIKIWFGKEFRLNEVASRIWELCDGHNTVANILTHLSNEYGEVETLRADLEEILLLMEYDCLIVLNYNPLHSLLNYTNQSYFRYYIQDDKKDVDLLLLVPPTPVPMTYGSSVNKLNPLGIGYIASYISAHGYKNIEIKNLWTAQLNKVTIIDMIDYYNPKIIGFSTMTDNYENGIEMARIIHEYNKSIIIMFGGSHATFEDINIVKNNNFVDVVIRNEGEQTVLELMECFIDNKKKLGDILGITYKQGSDVIRNADRPLIENLDALPFPERKVLLYDEFIGIQTSRGCVGQCIFCCAKGLSGGKYRKRSAENVVAEIELLYQKGIRKIFFQDDTVTVDIKRLNEIMDLLETKKIDITWQAESRVDVISRHPELIKRMKKSGCMGLQFGVESGSQVVLDQLKKNVTLEQIYEAVRLSCENKIGVMCTLLIGHPYENEKTIKETVEFAKSLIDLGAKTGLSIVCPYPGTDIRLRPDFYKVRIHEYKFRDYNVLNPVMDIETMNQVEIRNFYYNSTRELEDYEKQRN